MSTVTQKRLGVAAALTALMMTGWWLRAQHLGRLGLVADEGNQILAVRGILAHGVPKVDSGRLYTRGIPFLYTEAAAAKVFGLDEFSLRIPSVCFGVAVILMIYFLGKTLFDWRVGLMAAVLSTFSVWEIEMSRYARFYTAFQCMYLVSLLCFFQGFLRGRRPYQLWFIAAALITISMHELGVVLAACFLLPLFSKAFTPRDKTVSSVGAVGLVGLWILYYKLLSPLKGIADAAPLVSRSQAMAAITDRFLIPDVRLAIHLAHAHPAWLASFSLLPLVATAWLIFRGVRAGEGWRLLIAAPILWAAFLHQFGLVLVLWLVYLAFFARSARDLLDPVLKVSYGVAGICLVFWLIALATGAGPGISRSVVVDTMFSYPNVYGYFLSWFVKGWPVMTAVLALGSVWLAARYCAERTAIGPLLTLGALYLPAIIASGLRNEFYAARYTFHLYPLMVIIVSVVAIEIGSRMMRMIPVQGRFSRAVLIGILGVVALVISQDANPASALAVSEQTYRSANDPIRGPMNWKWYAGFHQDCKSPGLYVRDHLRPGDRVVALSPPHKVAIFHYYVGRVDYAVEEHPKTYQYRLRESGKVIDHVTGSEVLEDLKSLRAVCEQGSGGGVWLLGDWPLLAKGNYFYSEPMKEYLRSLARRSTYVGLDGQTFAVKVR